VRASSRGPRPGSPALRLPLLPRLPLLAVLALSTALPGRAALANDRVDFELTPDPRPLESVDPARAGRMAELGSTAERIRGLKLVNRPPWLVKSPREVYAFMLRGIQAEATPREVELATKLYAAFGFWKPDFDLLSAQLDSLSGAVRAFYNRTDDDFTLVRAAGPGRTGLGRGMDSEEEAEVVHEYTHALQAHSGLMAGLPMAGGNDRSQASRALVEGDAVLAMSVQLVESSTGRQGADPAAVGRVLGMIRMSMASMIQSPLLRKYPPVIGASLIFSYTGGSSFAEAAYKRGGWAEVNGCYAVPPLSTEQIIHPEKYFLPVPEDPVHIEPPDVRAALLPGAQIVDLDALGEMEITVLLAGFVPQAEARRSAAGWGGELYAAFERTAGPRRGEMALAWLTVWDTEADAAEFFESYSKALDRKCGLERRTVKAGELLDWRGPGAARESRLERRGLAVLSVEGADELETAALAAHFWSLKRSPPPPRRRAAPAAPVGPLAPAAPIAP